MQKGVHPFISAALAAWLGLLVGTATAAERAPPPRAMLEPLDGAAPWRRP
jgi:hypothetical protein